MGIPADLNQRTNSICKEGRSRYGEEKTKLVPGARIELATPAFSGRRSTNELPRHWCLEIVGVMRSRVNSAKKQVVGQPDQELGDATTIRTRAPCGIGERTSMRVSSTNEARTACYVLYRVWPRWVQHEGRKRSLLQNQRRTTLQRHQRNC